jgi:hypothetical protein
MHWPHVEKAVAWLREQGRQDLAIAVESCRVHAINYEKWAAIWRVQYEEMKGKYEPRTNVEPYTQSGD